MKIEHQRKAFQYAISFLEEEIASLKDSIKDDHLLDGSLSVLKQRLQELEKDYEDLFQYGFQN
ncbi:hypothetical protein [Metabacillus fastidiosus]|uniref:hypothetical protein n=1 Tax=Metabacillus fastidiosus TaxID=1458 RepID=UPI003D280091